jgi:UDP-4-amino-4,6-dideoxy-N-acetyl-beta-L-altrosamine N-acetyltransferase
MQNPFLIGENLYLRPLERTDAPRIMAWLNDPEVRRYLLGRWPINLPAEEAFLDQLSKDQERLVLGMVLKGTEELIGVLGFHQIEWWTRQAAFGITLGAKEHWGQGYGTEATRLLVGHAFATMNLHRVWLHVYEFNARAIRTYEKVGFQREGVLRQDAFRDGRYWDTYVMAILRDEWGKS